VADLGADPGLVSRLLRAWHPRYAQKTLAAPRLALRSGPAGQAGNRAEHVGTAFPR